MLTCFNHEFYIRFLLKTIHRGLPPKDSCLSVRLPSQTNYSESFVFSYGKSWEYYSHTIKEMQVAGKLDTSLIERS
jgi:hypothetical protein